MRYSIKIRYQIYVKRYVFLSYEKTSKKTLAKSDH